ncbi:hypothetical protein ACRYCC_41215 [Actinomadura scrupuli]|uniref:hypothetical protein n=1 Tax=Actinomadura scrupuli TaxID=559629 RepID=UPI003D962888
MTIKAVLWDWTGHFRRRGADGASRTNEVMNEVTDATAPIVVPLQELLAGGNHVVSVMPVGVVQRTGRTPAEPRALADRLYRAGGVALKVAAVRPVPPPWRDRLHQLVAAQIPTTASWSSRQPPRQELSAQQIERVTALTDELADVIEARLGPISSAFEMSSHSGDYRAAARDIAYSYDLSWDDLLLVSDGWGALLHIGLTD